MGDLSSVQSSGPVILLIGPPLVGKSVLSSQFPKPTFISMDGNMSSILSMRAQHRLDFNMRVFSIDEAETTDPEFLELCPKFQKMSAWDKVKKLVSVISRQMKADETLVIDPLTRLCEYLVNHIEKMTNHHPIQIQDWMTFTDELLGFFDMIKSSARQCNVIIIAHDQIEKNEVTGDWTRLLLIPSRLRYRIPSIATDYLYYKVDVRGAQNSRKVKRILQTAPDPMIVTGSRFLIPDIESPTYEKLRPFFSAALNRDLGEPTWTPKDGN